MKRIAFLFLAFLMAVAAPLSAVAADSPKALFVYWRGPTECDKGLKEELAKQGVNVTIEEINAEQDKAKLAELLAAVNEKDFSFIYTFGTTVSLAAAKQFKETPVLFGIVTAPVKSGLIQSWEAPGGNVTGVSHAIAPINETQLITSLGELKKVGIIFNNGEKNSQLAATELEKLLQPAGIELVSYPVESEDAISVTVAKMVGDGLNLVYLPSDSMILTNSDKIIPELNKAKIPTYGALEKQIQSGAMIGIVSSYYKVGQELAAMAAMVLEGKKPAEIPSKQMPFEQQTILVNAKTAEIVGFEIPYAILENAKIIE